MRGDTWGISGPAFIGIYLAATVACLFLTLLLRRWVSQAGPMQRELHPYEVAYLIGGPRHAVATAVAGLRADGAIECVGNRELRASDRPRTMRTPLDSAIYETLRAGMVTDTRSLEHTPEVRRGTDDLANRLIAAGLAAGPRQRRNYRRAALPMVAVLVLGIVRLLAGAANGHSVGMLIGILFVVVILTVRLVKAPRTTGAGTKAVRSVRSRSSHLNPSMSPAWATYGAVGAALGVALFGIAAMRSIDPAFAEAAAMQQQLAAASAGGRGSGGSSCGGSSCGGGGCGGGCGG